MWSKHKKKGISFDEEIELNGLKRDKRRTISDENDKRFRSISNENDKRFFEKLRELDEICKNYDRQIIAFWKLREKELIELKILYLKKELDTMYVEDVLPTFCLLDAALDDINNLLKTLDKLKTKVDECLAFQLSASQNQKNIVIPTSKQTNQYEKKLIEIKSIQEKTRTEIFKLNMLKNDTNLIKDDLRQLTNTEEFKKEIIQLKKRDDYIVRNINKIIDYVNDTHAKRYYGFTKSDYFNEAYQDCVDRMEDKALGGPNYPIENVIFAFKVFLVCCLQSKENNIYFCGLFKNSRTATGDSILSNYKTELLHILYRDRDKAWADMDYKRLASDLWQEARVRKAAEKLIQSGLTIKDWVSPQSLSVRHKR